VVSQSAAEDARTQETAAHGRLAAAPSRKLTRTSPEKAFLSYSAPFATRIGPGGREERREAHQGLVDGSGAAETMCSGEERTGCRAHAEEGAPTWVVASQHRYVFLGTRVRQTKGEPG
jgi:hypothetical protein